MLLLQFMCSVHAIMRGCEQLSKYILCYVYMVCNNVTSLCFEFNIIVINIEASHQYCCLFVSVFSS
jgi:hypothetical protein